MATFEVDGPYVIQYEKRSGGRTLVFDGFWDEDAPAAHLGDECGCYVFAIRNRGLVPIYVGKAAVSFRQETFNPNNRHKYHNGFSAYAKGTPIMYFVVHPKQRGRTNVTQIEAIEDFLIQAGVAKNPELQNVKGAQQPKWSIKGVIRSGRGRRGHAEMDIIDAFDIQD